MNQPDKDLALIPEGDYCYRLTGETVLREHVRGEDGRLLKVTPYPVPERKVCPYWGVDKRRPAQENGYCRFLGKGDWELGPISLLWDQVKECGVNLGETVADDKDAE